MHNGGDKMKKKGICLGLAAILIFTFSVSGMAFASSQSELEEDLASVESERDEVSQRLSEVMDQIETLQPQVDALDAEVAEANSKIVATENEIAQKEEEMSSREDGLNERLRVMYKNGSVGFIDVLLGSNSISEFISNLDLIQRIYKNDMDVLETLQKEHEELEDLRAELQQDKADLDQKRAELESQVAELDSLKAELEAKEDELLAQAEDLNQQIQDMIDTGSDYVGGGSWVWPAPASHYLTSYFGWRIHPVYGTWKYHSGIDIAASSGTNVLAAASGTVILSQKYGGYGQCIIIDHGGGITSLYGHMIIGSQKVSVGDTVQAGQVIGLVGSSGVSSGPHLHFEVREGGTLVDPLNYVS